MRSAICLYGQPREFYRNWKRIYDHIVLPNNCDVFFHSWYNPGNRHMKKMCPGHENRVLPARLETELHKITNAKNYKLESQRNFSIDRGWKITPQTFDLCWPWAKVYDKKTFENDRNFAHQSMWYSISESIRLKEDFATKNSFIYDYVALSRFDVAPTQPIKFENYDPNVLNSHSENKPRGEISDWFMFAKNDIMNIVSCLYNCLDFHMKNLSKNNKVTVNEAFLREHMELFGIKTKINEDIKIKF